MIIALVDSRSARIYRYALGELRELSEMALSVPDSAEPGETAVSRKRAVRAAVVEVAGYLGNTPTVARSSYIDPRVIDALFAVLVNFVQGAFVSNEFRTKFPGSTTGFELLRVLVDYL